MLLTRTTRQGQARQSPPTSSRPGSSASSVRTIALARDSGRHGDDAQPSASPAAASSKGGAAQPANDDDGATQHAPASPTASSDAETDAVETAAAALHQNLKTLEENEEDPRVMAELGMQQSLG